MKVGDNESSAKKGSDLFHELQSIDEWEVLDQKERPVAIQISAEWCRPCQTLKPMMKEAVFKKQGKVEFLYIDIDKFPQLA